MVNIQMWGPASDPRFRTSGSLSGSHWFVLVLMPPKKVLTCTAGHSHLTHRLRSKAVLLIVHSHYPRILLNTDSDQYGRGLKFCILTSSRLMPKPLVCGPHFKDKSQVLLLVAKSCLTLAIAWTVAPVRLLCLWDFPGKNAGVGCHFLHQGSSQPRNRTCTSCLTGRFFTTEPPGKPWCLGNSDSLGLE